MRVEKERHGIAIGLHPHVKALKATSFLDFSSFTMLYL
jgi:hypothetical protein